MKLLVIGCGKMGGSILHGYLRKNPEVADIRVIEPNETIRAELKAECITAFEKLSDLDKFIPDVVFTAVKPFLIGDIIDELKTFAEQGATFFTIIAGKKMEFFTTHLGEKTPIIRAMPNTPASIGKGITGLIANEYVSDVQKQNVENLLAGCGEIVWLKNESEIDAVTAISGSGPAYIFHLTEALCAAAKALNLSDETAEKLAKATVIGSAYLMEQSGIDPAILRQNVTTPNGTTAAALNILMDEQTGFESLMKKATKAAEQRSVELAK